LELTVIPPVEPLAILRIRWRRWRRSWPTTGLLSLIWPLLGEHDVVAFDKAHLFCLAAAHFVSVVAVSEQLDLVPIVPVADLQAVGVLVDHRVVSFVRLAVTKDRSTASVEGRLVAGHLFLR
jgi:hypothetical protein